MNLHIKYGTGTIEAYSKGITIKADKKIINTERTTTNPYQEAKIYVKIVENISNYIKQHLDELDSTIKLSLDILSSKK